MNNTKPITFDDAMAKKNADDKERQNRIEKRLIGDHSLTADQITHNEIADMLIAESYFDSNDLPDFPMIKHPIMKEWMSIASKLTYSRVPYHFANLLPILSMGIGRRMCAKVGLKKIYCNVNVMTSGVSTISGKSYSSDCAVDAFVPAIVNEDLETSVNYADHTKIISKTISSARLIMDLSVNNNIFWYYDESREFFIDADGWNKPILTTLRTAYDGGKLSRKLSTRNHAGDATNNAVCETPYLSLLFNMTLTELKETSTGSLFSSGFTPRWMWFVESGGKMRKNITPDDDDDKLIKNIHDEIHRAAKTFKDDLDNDSIICRVNDDIETWKMNTSQKYGGSEDHQTAIGRGFIHIYKIAMILSAYDPEFQKQIFKQKTYPVYVDLPDNCVKEAIIIVDQYLFPRMIKVMKMAETEDKTNKQLIVINKLKELGGSAIHSELLRKTRMSSVELGITLKTLQESEEINAVAKHVPGKPGFGATTYCLNTMYI